MAHMNTILILAALYAYRTVVFRNALYSYTLPDCTGNTQKHIIVSIENVKRKSQISTLILNIPKFKWDGAEEPTINNFLKKIVLSVLLVRINRSIT